MWIATCAFRHEKSYPFKDQVQSFPAAKKAYVQLRGKMVGHSDARRKREKIRPIGTISREAGPSTYFQSDHALDAHVP